MLSPGDPLSGTAVILPSTSNFEASTSSCDPMVFVLARPSIALMKLQSDSVPV